DALPISFLLTKTNYKKYLTLASITAVICLPHLDITLHHLEIGGLSWLPKPNSEFYPKFIDFAFNNSTLWQTLIALSFVIPFLDIDRKSTRLNSSHVKISYAV